MKRSEAFPTKFLSKDDIAAPAVGVIEKVVNETLGQGDDQEVKPVMYWASGIPKPMVINNTNWMNVEAVHGDESDNWKGKAIEVWVDPTVSFGGKRIGGLRLRAPADKPSNGNGSPRLRLFTRWAELTEQARALDLEVPELDLASSDADVIKAGKELAARIAAVQNEAAF